MENTDFKIEGIDKITVFLKKTAKAEKDNITNNEMEEFVTLFNKALKEYSKNISKEKIEKIEDFFYD